MGKARKIRRSFRCLSCGFDTLNGDEYYALHDAIWLIVNPKHDGMLCIGCAEERIGRRLRPEDFPACPINDPNDPLTHMSARLLSRITGEQGQR